MLILRVIPYIDTHTAGEGTRVLFGDAITPLGSKAWEWLVKNAETIRKIVLQEPRGHSGLVAAVLTQPTLPKADLGVIFWDNEGALQMCVHGTIGAVAAMRLLGKISRQTSILQTPAGLITICVNNDDTITVYNVPAFYLTTIFIGKIPVDIAYGGNLCALIPIEHLKIKMTIKNISKFIHYATMFKQNINKNFQFEHPETQELLNLALIQFYSYNDPSISIVVFGNGQVDRSPCGTGTSARMAVLYAKGQLKCGDSLMSRSIFGGEFVGRIVDEVQIGDKMGVIPAISGAAFITGMGFLMLQDKDVIFKDVK